ncbi:MAG TPA: LysR substrate-binding domain-containing protein [Woeseiaceae bacterium]|nr:LysR substrate-binding domain-containing protein [Woeseiaceae bacterium]
MASKLNASLRGLRTFCIAARYESFRVAADELFITSSAVSHQIKSLEEELGVKLFERGSRELKLTETGAAMFAEINPLIEELDTLVGQYREGGRRRSIRMSVQPFFASEYFIPRLSEFSAEHPDIDIQVDTSDESSEKHPADADVSIRLFKSPPEGTRSNLLVPLRLVAAGSAEFKKTIKLVDGEITSRFPLIVHETYPKAWKQWSKRAGVKLPSDSKITRLGSMIAVVRAAERGLGAALVPVPLADQWFRQRTITRLFEDELVADVSYYLVCREDRADDEDVRCLHDWILREFGDQA